MTTERAFVEATGSPGRDAAPALHHARRRVSWWIQGVDP